MTNITLSALVEEQRYFSKTTFGSGQMTARILDHITSEIEEVRQAPHDLSEWADIVLLALDGAWRTGVVSDAISRKG